MNAGSLFSGIGGFDLGFERAGIRTAWQVERDKYARATLATHFPNAKQYEDVNYVGKENLETVNLISGGFPCQDVSVAGRRAGLAGNRSGLWFEFHRILSELKPAWVVVENVPGLLSSNGGRDFAVVIRGLVKCGYGVAWRVLDSQYFGVPQRRRRVFIVGHLGTGRAAQVLFEPTSGARRVEPGATTRQGAADDVKSCVNENRVVGTLSASGAGTSRTGNAYSEADMLIYHRMLGFGHNDRSRTASTIQSRDYKYATDLITAQTYDARNHRLNGDISGTLQAKPNGGYSLNYINPVHVNNSVRRLTPTECERLQGFPDGWTAQHSDTQRYKQLGNAVTVNVAEWIARRIVVVEQSQMKDKAA